MTTSNHARSLASNRGEGNWGDDPDGVGASNDNNKILHSDTAVDSFRSIYFPHGATKQTAPSARQDFFGSIDFIGWSAKTNWLIQANGVWDTARLYVYAVRPTGIEELVANPTAISGTVITSLTHGGIESEEIRGPIRYFRFAIPSTGTGDTTANTDVDCYVVGWNEGDLGA